jgi:hypothetical protein
MLEGGAGLKHEGVAYREIREDTEPTRLGFTPIFHVRLRFEPSCSALPSINPMGFTVGASA